MIKETVNNIKNKIKRTGKNVKNFVPISLATIMLTLTPQLQSAPKITERDDIRVSVSGKDAKYVSAEINWPNVSITQTVDNIQKTRIVLESTIRDKTLSNVYVSVDNAVLRIKTAKGPAIKDFYVRGLYIDNLYANNLSILQSLKAVNIGTIIPHDIKLISTKEYVENILPVTNEYIDSIKMNYLVGGVVDNLKARRMAVKQIGWETVKADVSKGNYKKILNSYISSLQEDGNYGLLRTTYADNSIFNNISSLNIGSANNCTDIYHTASGSVTNVIQKDKYRR